MGNGKRACGPIFAVLMTLLAACETPTIGTSFSRPPPDFVRLGETTRAQIVAEYGKPAEERQVRADGHLLSIISYYHGNREEAPRIPGSVCVRTLQFAVSADIVVAEAFSSNCEADHTDFDDSRVASIVKGTSRCDTVIAALGRPTSRSIYPANANKDELSIGYSFEAMGPGPSFAPTVSYRYRKQLEVICSQDGIVRDVSFFESGKR